MAAGIYMIEHEQTGKKYIGQSLNIQRRISDHLDYTSMSTALSADVEKYGKQAFRWEILQEWKNPHGKKKEIDAAERRWILTYETQEPNGYNKVLPKALPEYCEFQKSLFDIRGSEDEGDET